VALISEETVALVRGVAAEAERLETPCGDGHMVWHVWGSGPPLMLLRVVDALDPERASLIEGVHRCGSRPTRSWRVGDPT